MTRVDRLRKDGWPECGTCGGSGKVDCFCSYQCDYQVACLDCVDGRVPPDGMVEAAAKAMEQLAPFAPLQFRWHRLARAALVTAARWEVP